MRLSILDDYQGVALDMADWSAMRGRGVEIASNGFRLPMRTTRRGRLADSEIVARCANAPPFPKRSLTACRS